MATVAYTNTSPHPQSIGGKLIMPGQTRDVNDVGLTPAVAPEAASEPETEPTPAETDDPQ